MAMILTPCRIVSRDRDNPTGYRGPHVNSEQRLEPTEWGGYSTISTVAKDNVTLIAYV